MPISSPHPDPLPGTPGRAVPQTQQEPSTEQPQGQGWVNSITEHQVCAKPYTHSLAFSIFLLLECGLQGWHVLGAQETRDGIVETTQYSGERRFSLEGL